MFKNKKILFIGAGKMGFAMLSKVAESEDFAIENIDVIDPIVDENFIKDIGVNYFKTLDSLLSTKAADYKATEYKADVIFIAIKPQNFDEVLKEYKKICDKKTVIISIAAGKTISAIEKIFEGHAVVRCMPNLPAIVGHAVTGYCTNKKCKPAQEQLAVAILEKSGKVLAFKEKMMDSVTAISGSGPAYVFHFCEALENAAQKLGFSAEEANILAKQTIIGAAELLKNSDKSTSQLKKDVTSKGGTTEAALNILEKNDALTKLLGKTTKAAQKRAKELN